MKQALLLTVALSAGFNSATAQTASLPVTNTPAPITAAPSPAPAPVSPAGATLRLPADTPVRIELTQAVSSNGGVRGNKFTLQLAAPIIVDGRIVAPVGSPGVGEIVYAEAASGGGAPGKLVLAARYIDVGGVRVRLKAFNLSAGGDDEFRKMAVAAALIGVGVMFINGHDVLYPVGIHARAKVAEDVMLPAGPPAPVAAAGDSPSGAAMQAPAQTTPPPSPASSQPPVQEPVK